MDIPLLNPRALTFLLNNIRKRNSFCAVRRPPFCNINSKMASGRWLAKVLGNYKAAQAGGQNAGIHSRPVHAMLSLIYIALLFPLGRLFSVLCAQCPRFWYCFKRPWEQIWYWYDLRCLHSHGIEFLFAVQVHDTFDCFDLYWYAAGTMN